MTDIKHGSGQPGRKPDKLLPFFNPKKNQ